MKSFAAILLLLALIANAGASQGRSRTEDAVHHLGLAHSSLASTEADVAVHHTHGRHLLVDYKGSDPIGADTVGNGKGPKVTSLSLAPTMAPGMMMASAPITSASMFPAAQPYGAAAPVSAPFGQSAPSVLGRRLLVDYKGSDPVGADTKGNGAVLSVGSGASYAKALLMPAPAESPTTAPSSAGGPVPLSTILYSSVPTAGKYTLAAAPKTAPGAMAAPGLAGVAGRRLLA